MKNIYNYIKNITINESNKLKNILIQFNDEIEEASKDKHDIESAYEEVILKYKRLYPEYIDEIQDEFNIGSKRIEDEINNLKVKESFKTTIKLTENDINKIASVIGQDNITINDVDLAILYNGKYTLIKSNDGSIELLKYNEETKEFNDFKFYASLDEFLNNVDILKESITNEDMFDINAINTFAKILIEDDWIDIDDFNELKDYTEFAEYCDNKMNLYNREELNNNIDFDNSKGDILNAIIKQLNKIDKFKGFSFLKESITNEDTFEFREAADDMYDDEKDYIIYELGDIWKRMDINPNLQNLLVYDYERALLDNKSDLIFKFISMLKSLYTPEMSIDGNFLYNLNGLYVWIYDKNANINIYINSKDKQIFEEEFYKIV